MDDTKEPAFGIFDNTDVWQCDERLDHCILNDVLAINGGTGHSGGVSVELGAEFAQQSFEFVERLIGHGSDVERDDGGIGANAVCDAGNVA